MCTDDGLDEVKCYYALLFGLCVKGFQMFSVVQIYSDKGLAFYNEGQKCGDTSVKMAPFCIVDVPHPLPLSTPTPSPQNQCCILDPQVFLLLQTTLMRGSGALRRLKGMK